MPNTEGIHTLTFGVFNPKGIHVGDAFDVQVKIELTEDQR
jgi:hypothetical protein